ncbi:MAG: hypothetical protein F6K42_38480, partial [Leptolyngbya sp. SIO1D8]|nr:hypothetical protein [Leptolyngbya sp. SIO1D8]
VLYGVFASGIIQGEIFPKFKSSEEEYTTPYEFVDKTVPETNSSGFTGVGLIGGAAMGAATGFANAPRLVTIEPGQIIEVEVVAEILPFNDAPNVTQ